MYYKYLLREYFNLFTMKLLLFVYYGIECKKYTHYLEIKSTQSNAYTS
ncbi:hypothetical protein QE390_001992 [Siphonobacter sp. SORGH_AS 1065]|nr:hypothetical protein [Siphonobacter sp. SORGH_AS_1065]